MEELENLSDDVNQFLRKIRGLVSFYRFSDIDILAKDPLSLEAYELYMHIRAKINEFEQRVRRLTRKLDENYEAVMIIQYINRDINEIEMQLHRLENLDL